jgi:hypothetical protein
MVVFDTTGSMGDSIAQAKEAALRLAGKVLSRPNGRIGLVQFRDQGDSPEVELVLGLTSSGEQFASALGTLVADGGGDGPEAQLAGILTALNGVDWRAGATKLVTVITDSPGKDPDPITGATTADVVRRANEIDPVGLYGVDVCGCVGAGDWMQPLAEGTGGNVVTGTDGVELAFEQVLSDAGARPVVLLPDTTYAEPGIPVTFSAEGSYDPDSTITGYRWDLDGDGTFETETADPTVTHTYESEVSFTVTAVAVADDGGSGAAATSLVVRSGWREALTPSRVGAPSIAEAGPGAVRVAWRRPTSGPVPTSYALYDATGISAAFVPASETEVVIDGLAPGSDQRFVIRAVSQGLESEPVSTRTIRLSRKQPPPPGGDHTPPVLSHLRVSPQRFRPGTRRGLGTLIRFNLSEPAKVRLEVQRRFLGRLKKAHGRARCVAVRQNSAHRRTRPCYGYTTAGVLRTTGHAGNNELRFSGRLRSRSLRVARYRITGIAKDGAGNPSTRRTASFAIQARQIGPR